MVIKVRKDEDFFHSTFGEDEFIDEPLTDLEAGSILDAEFRRLALLIPTLCWIANADGYIVWYNKGWHDYTGTTPAEMEGWGWQSVHDPELLPTVLERWRASIATGHPFEMVFPLRGADGTFRPFLTRVRPVRDNEGQIKRWYGLNAGISAQVAAENALSESAQRFALIQKVGRIGGFDYDINGDHATCTEELFELFGMEKGSLSSLQDFAQLIHPEDRERELAAVASAIECSRSLNQRYRIIRRDNGQVRWISSQAQMVGDQVGQNRRFVGGLMDVTESHRASILREAQNRVLELALESPSIEKSLSALIEALEELSESGVKGSILLLDNDGRRLRHGAAPSLDKAYIDAIDGIEIGPCVGSCGTAAHRREAVHVTDIAKDPLWAEFKDLALGNGLAACWSTPIFSGGGDVLGTFAMYYSESREAAEEDLQLIDFVTRSAALIIERDRSERALLNQAETLEILNGLGQALAGELDLERLVTRVTDSGVQLAGAAFGAFFYNVISESESYMLYTISGVAREEFSKFPMPRATKVFKPTFDGASVVRSADITRDKRYGKNSPYSGMPEGHLPVRSYLAVPVISRSGEVIGGLFFGHPEPNRFDEHHERILVGVAGQAAVAIDNARLFEAAQQEIAVRVRAEEAVREMNATLEDRVAEQIAAREKTEEALRQAQKMEAVGQLTGGIAHDFNNLLTIIGGNIDTLRRALGDSLEPRLARALANSMTGVDRATTLTQRLLAFSRRQPLKPTPVEPNHLVSEMSSLLHRTLGETIEIETVLAAGLWGVEVDPNQLESALINLAVNARDAIFAKSAGGNGKLTIETANVHFDREYSSSNAEIPVGQYVAICVTDTGSGMDGETKAKAFEPFFTTKEVGKGTGLGLSMVYGFVRQSGGHVKIYSEEGEGTTVKLYLPRFIKPSSTVQDTPVISKEVSRGEGSILVCEDDDEVRAYSVDLLRELGYRVLEAHDGPSALRLLKRQNGEVDLLFTDVVLPSGMTGAEVATEARRIQPNLKVLFTTGYARNAIVHHGRLDKGVELITKPFSYSELAQRVSEILNR